jgi:hypothetical protein
VKLGAPGNTLLGLAVWLAEQLANMMADAQPTTVTAPLRAALRILDTSGTVGVPWQNSTTSSVVLAREDSDSNRGQYGVYQVLLWLLVYQVG